MRIKKIVALVLTGVMLMGQTAYAQEPENEKETVDMELGTNEADTKELTDKESLTEGKESDNENKVKQNTENQGVEKNQTVEKKVEEGQPVVQSNITRVGEEAFETKEKDVYLNAPVIVEEAGEMTGVQIEDENVCSAEILRTVEQYGRTDSYIQLEGKKAGSTTITVMAGEEKCYEYQVTVAELPDDVALIEDIALRSYLLSAYCNKNKDGYISTQEIEELYSIYWGDFYREAERWGGVESLRGLEKAVNLFSIDLQGCDKLTDISPLFGLTELESACFDGNPIPDEDRWKLSGAADKSEIVAEKGNYITLVRVNGILEDYSVELMDQTGAVDKNEYQSCIAKECGTERIKIAYKDLETIITVTVEGIPADQPLGDTYEENINIGGQQEDNVNAILSSNGQLWQTYPEIKRAKENVKSYVAEKVYTKDYRREKVNYIWDNDNNLWNGEEKIAENVKKVDGRYILDSSDTLIDIYQEGTIPLENVKEWKSPIDVEENPETYVLKIDGTLWSRIETQKEDTPNQFTQIAENVKQVTRLGYINIDGSFSFFEEALSPIGMVSYVVESRGWHERDTLGFMGTDGKFYLRKGGIEGRIEEVGKLSVEDFFTKLDSVFLLTEQREAYEYNIKTQVLTKLSENVKCLNQTRRPWYRTWIYQLVDGTYCGMNPEEKVYVTELVIHHNYRNSSEYELYQESEKIPGEVKMNEIVLLNNVMKIWQSGENVMALRADGTIWNLMGIPEKIADLQEESYIRGDVNEDQNVDIQDLRLVLRGVCEKVVLTERQNMIADVTDDGTVNIQDLRKELRFVCGKIDVL